METSISDNRPVELQTLTCHNIKNTGETKNIIDYLVLSTLPASSEPAIFRHWNPKMNVDHVNVINLICSFLAVTC